MTLIEVKRACIGLLQTPFPTSAYNYYNAAVVENYKRPAIFTQLKITALEPGNYNSERVSASFYITYLQAVLDELDAYRFAEAVRIAFRQAIRVQCTDDNGDGYTRYVDVTGFEYDLSGTDRNIMEIAIDLEWHEVITRSEIADIMETLEVDKKLKVNYKEG